MPACTLQIQERNDHLQMLNELEPGHLHDPDFQELLQMVLAFCLRITQAEIGYIFIARTVGQEPAGFADLECQASQDSRRPLEEVQVSQQYSEGAQRQTGLCVVDMQNVTPSWPRRKASWPWSLRA